MKYLVKITTKEQEGMTVREFVEKWIEDNQDKLDWSDYIGLRYDHKDVKEGEILANSKTTFFCDDIREYPQYGSKEYEKLPEQDGTSAWLIYADNRYREFDWDSNIGAWGEESKCGKHLSIVSSKQVGENVADDLHEILLRDCKVEKVLW